MRTRLSLLLLSPLIALGQSRRTITGRVLSESDHSPLPGASVYVDSKMIGVETKRKGVIENTAIGTVTDSVGYFILKIPESVKQVAISYMGYKTQRLPLSTQAHYIIYLTENRNVLKEIVVTGYQKIEKRKLTGAVDQLAVKDIRQAGVSNIADLLQGQAAGVVVSPQTGAPGEIPRIRIRGTASLNGPQDPLWVVDGLPLAGNDVPHVLDKDNIDQLRNYSIAGLDPRDIANITILKDAAATSIYGARAANGVVVVTTKRGKSGKMRVNAYTNISFTQRPDFDRLNLMDANQKVDFELALAKRTDLIYRTQKGAVARILKASDELDLYRKSGFSALGAATRQSIEALRTHTVDWGKLLYRPAVNQQYGVSLSGGAKNSDYYLSLGYYDEKGATIGTGFKRYNISLKNHYTLSDKFKAGVSLFASQSKKESYLTYTDAFTNPSYYARHANPYLQPYTAAGNYNYDRDIRGYESRYIPFSFLEERAHTAYDLKNQALKAIFDAGFQITNDLSASAQLGLQVDQTAAEKFADRESYYTRKYRQTTRRYDSKSKTYRYFLPEGGIIRNSNGDFFQYNLKALLNYHTRIGERHEIEALVGSEWRRTKSKGIRTRGFGYNPKTLTTKTILFPKAHSDVSGDESYKTYGRTELENAYTSVYSTASYTYDRKYTVFGSIRYDGSNLFGVDPKYKYLPIWSISGSWSVSDESFLKSVQAISNLRLRLSYGFQGNIDRGTSPFVIGSYETATILPDKIEDVITVTQPPNDKLRWEKTKNVNVGADLGLFKNKVDIAFDSYIRRGTDLVGNQKIHLETGFEYTKQNGSQITNKGFELSIATENIKTRYFSWTTGFNIAHNKSRVDYEVYKEDSFLPSREGNPVNAVFALKTAGIDTDGYPLFWKGDQRVSAVEFFDLYDPWAAFYAGEMVSSKLSKEAFSQLFTYIGDADPQYSGGITNRISYKNFDLTLSASFSLNQTLRRTPPYSPTQVDRGLNYPTDILRAHPTGDLPGIRGATSPSASKDAWMTYKWYGGLDDSGSYYLLDMWVREMSWLRISSIRLGWTLPQNLSQKMHIDQLRLSMEVRNPFVIGSDYNGYFDPETYGNSYAQPIPKSLSLGLHVSL